MSRVPRLYVPGRLGPGVTVLNDEQARRLGEVVRLRVGDEFRLFAGDGKEWQATVAGMARGEVHARVTEVVREEAPLPLVVEVWCGLVRPNRFDWAIEKCTEAGADIIRPIVTARAARGEEASAQRQERWSRIAVEAAEQSGRLSVPVVEAPAQFADLVGRRPGMLVIGDALGPPWAEASRAVPAQGRVVVAVGPEGGFTPDEVARAKAAGAALARFGPNVLRTETAAVAAVALIRSIGR